MQKYVNLLWSKNYGPENLPGLNNSGKTHP